MKDRCGSANVDGIAGTLHQIRDRATMMLLATYVDPVVGRLLKVMPIDSQRVACNDPFFVGNIDG